MDFLTQFVSHVDYTAPLLYVLLGLIAFNPIFWNCAARLEYKHHTITLMASGNPRWGCYMLAFTIFTLGILRDLVYHNALMEQPEWTVLTDSLYVKLLAFTAFGYGNVLVILLMYVLGVTGTYLGDYFGILMEERVTGFPFNVCDNPMYVGSTLCFLGSGLWYGRPTGVLVLGFVYIMYRVACTFEEPFTAMIYAKKAEEDAKKQQ